MKRPLRIAVFTGSFPVLSETFILRQITGLLDLGHHVDIYADTPPDPGSPVHADVAKYRLIERTTYMGMPAAAAPWEIPIYPITGRTWIPGAATSELNFLRLLRALPCIRKCLSRNPRLTLRLLSRKEYPIQAASLSGIYRFEKVSSAGQKPDLVHAHFGPVANNFRFLRDFWKVPLVVSFHGYDCSAIPHQQGSDVYNALFAAADCITVNSDFMRARLITLGCPSERMVHLPYGIDVKALPFKLRSRRRDEPVRLITIARLVEKKGIEYVMRALHLISQTNLCWRYDIVGDGPLRAELEMLASSLRLEDRVTFHGALRQANVRDILNQSHIFVLASVTGRERDQEGTPVSLLEAQAGGMPVIATRHGGIPEIVLDGESGCIVPERNVAALAAALETLCARPERWEAMGRAGRAFVANRHDNVNCIRRLEELYATLVAKKI